MFNIKFKEENGKIQIVIDKKYINKVELAFEGLDDVNDELTEINEFKTFDEAIRETLDGYKNDFEEEIEELESDYDEDEELYIDEDRESIDGYKNDFEEEIEELESDYDEDEELYIDEEVDNSDIDRLLNGLVNTLNKSENFKGHNYKYVFRFKDDKLDMEKISEDKTPDCKDPYYCNSCLVTECIFNKRHNR